MAPGNWAKFLGLVLPGRAEVAVKVGILFQLGIAVGGQHLAVGVNVDALAGALLQDLLQVQEIVARHQDGLALLVPQGDLGGHRVAVSAGVAGIQQLHGPEVDFAAFQHQGHHVGDAQALGRGGRQPLVDEGVNLVVFLAQDLGVIGVSADPLEAEQQGVLQGEDVGVRRRVGFQAHRLGLLQHALQVGGRGEGGRACGKIGLAALAP